MDKYKKFIECWVPGTACNMRCRYCYESQLNQIDMKNVAHFSYSPEHIGKALRKERIGGCAYINVCGSGETLLPKELPEIIRHILMQGHYVNIYTNGTLTQRFDELCKFSSDLLERLSFAFSFHFLELKRLKMLDVFFANFNKMKSVGCSVVCNMVLDDSYLPYVDEIKQVTKKHLGAYPQISFPKKAHKHGNYTSLCEDDEESIRIGNTFHSPYLDFTEKYYNYDKHLFCYAGAWSFCLNLSTGDISKCYGHSAKQNIFKNVDVKIKYSPVGNFCQARACGGGLFLPMGVVPELKTPTYIDVKNRPEVGWYTNKYKEFLSQQLWQNNEQYSALKRLKINMIHPVSSLYYKGINFLRRKFQM